MDWSARIDIGLRGLLLRKVRALLSTLGVVFGVAAVIAMMSIGEGARREAVEQIKLLGTNSIRIKRLEHTADGRAQSDPRFPRGLTDDDATLLQQSVPGLAGVAPLKFLDADVRFDGRPGAGRVVGTTPEYADVTNFHVGEGRFITEFDVSGVAKVCVLGSEVKQRLFGYRDAVGASVRIGEFAFTVVGVMESKAMREGRTAAIKLRNINRDVYIPITTSLKRFSAVEETSAIEEIAIRVSQPAHLSSTAQMISRVLRLQHRGAQDYEVVVPEELLAQAQRTQRIFNVVMGSIAGISLLVGGIGIMNIMLATVSERTREIGIRRAIGATKADIMGQFITETVLICLAGGVIGILLGFGMAAVITVYATWETGFSLASVLVAFGTSASVGLLFGLYPARRAAQLAPAEALRFE